MGTLSHITDDGLFLNLNHQSSFLEACFFHAQGAGNISPLQPSSHSDFEKFELPLLLYGNLPFITLSHIIDNGLFSNFDTSSGYLPINILNVLIGFITENLG